MTINNKALEEEALELVEGSLLGECTGALVYATARRIQQWPDWVCPSDHRGTASARRLVDAAQ